MKLSWTGGEAGAFDCLPMGLVNKDRTKAEAQCRQGLERCSGANNSPIEG
jgi:hypothetical protein